MQELDQLCLWLIGGTEDSVAIERLLLSSELPLTLIITVTTANALSLYTIDPRLRVQVGAMTRTAMAQFCQTWSIDAIIDASHPYAVEVSQSAIATAAHLKIPYLRYERPRLSPVNSLPNSPKITILDSFSTLLAGTYLQGQRVLLTTGYKTLHLFQPWHDRATLFARILPALDSLTGALAAGFGSDRLLAIRPPLSPALETALWQQWQISLVVTKASGKAGGEDIKQQVAANLGIPLIVIDRPLVNYPQSTSDLGKVLDFCQQLASNLSKDNKKQFNNNALS